MGAPIYDMIGRGYTASRQPDPRIEARIVATIGDASTIVNVGAGTGNYEPTDCFVVAVEPSELMVRQRRPGAAPVVRGVAEALPFRNGVFDVALAIFTLHHWTELGAGLQELRRVASRQIALLNEPSVGRTFWLFEYFPEMRELPTELHAPAVSDLGTHLDVASVEVVPIPADCSDGFCGAFWSRPEAYLDARVRAGISSLAQLDERAVDRGAARLQRDLETGAWDERYGDLRALPEFDLGYRLVVAGDA
jgi:SAM-dependent methyltransferase